MTSALTERTSHTDLSSNPTYDAVHGCATNAMPSFQQNARGNYRVRQIPAHSMLPRLPAAFFFQGFARFGLMPVLIPVQSPLYTSTSQRFLIRRMNAYASTKCLIRQMSAYTLTFSTVIWILWPVKPRPKSEYRVLIHKCATGNANKNTGAESFAYGARLPLPIVEDTFSAI
jgi:hypothetical protein